MVNVIADVGNFYSLPYMRGDILPGLPLQLPYFYSLPYMRGDEVHEQDNMMTKFLFAPLHEGRPKLSSALIVELFLFAPLHEGRPQLLPIEQYLSTIYLSIMDKFDCSTIIFAAMLTLYLKKSNKKVFLQLYTFTNFTVQFFYPHPIYKKKPASTVISISLLFPITSN